MKLTAEGLRGFLEILPRYDRLSKEERRHLNSIEPAAKRWPYSVIRGSVQSLVATGFLLPVSNGRCPIDPSRLGFLTTLRLLRGHSVFQNPSQATFHSYANAHFVYAERDALPYGQVTSAEWVRDFLNTKDSGWEDPYRVKGADRLFTSPEILSNAQALIRWLTAHPPGGRIALRHLPPLTPTREQLIPSLHAALRYGLLYLAIDPESFDVVLGLWPEVVAEVTKACEPPPVPLCAVAPTKIFDPLFLVDDVTTLLVACGAAPLPVRADNYHLYTGTFDKLADSLRPLPKWVDDAFFIDCDRRMEIADEFAHAFKLTQRTYQNMSISERGRAWLKLPNGDRLRVFIDGLFAHRPTVAGFEDVDPRQMTAAATELRIVLQGRANVPVFPDAIMQVFRNLEGDGFHPIEEIAAFSLRTSPLVIAFRKDRGAYFTNRYGGAFNNNAESLEKEWCTALRDFLRFRLLPMGGIRVGQGPEGVSIAITPVGRYYLGQSNEWTWQEVEAQAQVIVQPNFEVTFLGEAPLAEIEIARFAERRGRQGVLFQITKKSIVAAAGAGMTAESVLELLERVSTREVPANVRREIQGWFGQCRKIHLEQVTLIRCPDRETALRVMGLAKDSVTALTDTVLEFRDISQKQRTALFKKLKEGGVLTSGQLAV